MNSSISSAVVLPDSFNQPIPFLLRFVESPSSSQSFEESAARTYMGTTPTEKGEAFDFEQDD